PDVGAHFQSYVSEQKVNWNTKRAKRAKKAKGSRIFVFFALFAIFVFQFHSRKRALLCKSVPTSVVNHKIR
ncbi:MAG: hypothetical protein MOB07_20345, partial [Acidobacteria bacterium]|nr:hypothetical protein [Acidobacteriota bacterium]